MAEKYEILPVPTRILTVHDNIVDAIKESVSYTHLTLPTTSRV